MFRTKFALFLYYIRDLISRFLLSKKSWVEFLACTHEVRYFVVQYNNMKRYRNVDNYLRQFMQTLFPEIEDNLKYKLLIAAVAYVQDVSYVSFKHSQLYLIFSRKGDDFEICIQENKKHTVFYRRHITNMCDIWGSMNENWKSLWNK